MLLPPAPPVPLPPWLALSLVELLVPETSPLVAVPPVPLLVLSLVELLEFVPLTSPLVAAELFVAVWSPVVALVLPTLPPLAVTLGVKVKSGVKLVSPMLPPAPPVALTVLPPLEEVVSPMLEAPPKPPAPPVALLVEVWSPLLPPVALDEPELVMVMEGVEPLPEPRPTT